MAAFLLPLALAGIALSAVMLTRRMTEEVAGVIGGAVVFAPLLFLLSACAGHVSSIETGPDGQRVERIYHDAGGSVREQRALWTHRIVELRIDRFVIDGGCASYCAFRALGYSNTCYTRNARVSVHPASFAGLVETPATRRLTAGLVARWPAGLRRWWQAHRPTVLGTTLSYDDLKRLIPERECRDGHVQISEDQ